MQHARQELGDWLLLGGGAGAVGFVVVALIEGAPRGPATAGGDTSSLNWHR
jgi:hypothetical protein